MLYENILYPVSPRTFVNKFKLKYQAWGNIVTAELRRSWHQNCLALNNCILNKNNRIKYVVSAPTGTAKTENIITYCAILPRDIKVLISTNLTSEADRLAFDINNESREQRAISYHSKKTVDTSEASLFQVVVVSHEFYRRNRNGNDIWDKLGFGRDLIIIDEALDTLIEYTISKSDVERAFNFFASIKDRFKGNKYFESNLVRLSDDLGLLENAQYDKTTLICTDKVFYMRNNNQEIVAVKSIEADRYFALKTFLGENSFDFNKILTGITDASKNEQIKESINITLEALSNFYNRQTYITANRGEYSLHRIEDSSCNSHTLICFDATACVNATYALREKFHNDLVLIENIKNIRKYSNVSLKTVATTTGSLNINNDLVNVVLNNIDFGEKTLFVTHKQNIPIVKAKLEANFSEFVTDVVNWGAVTGLNKWQNFDTCVILGLNHKPVSFVQNRVLSNTNENEAFGVNQKNHFDDVRISDLVSEIIQAINRIRIRKISNPDGECEAANIYLTLPCVDKILYEYYIQKHMPNIRIENWNLPIEFPTSQTTHGESVISYLLKTMKIGEKIHINEPRDVININRESYKSVLGKTVGDKDKFKSKLERFGFEIIDELVIGSNKKAIYKKFFRRIF